MGSESISHDIRVLERALEGPIPLAEEHDDDFSEAMFRLHEKGVLKKAVPSETSVGGVYNLPESRRELAQACVEAHNATEAANSYLARVEDEFGIR